jgi:hypothetical protein
MKENPSTDANHCAQSPVCAIAGAFTKWLGQDAPDCAIQHEPSPLRDLRAPYRDLPHERFWCEPPRQVHLPCKSANLSGSET